MIKVVAAAVVWLALLGVIVVAGVHTVYYLFEWEWVRAQIAGTAFVAGLVVGATYLILGKLQRIERRLDRLVQSQIGGAVTSPDVAPVEPVPDFPWLSAPAHPQALALAVLLVPAVVPAAPPDRSVFIPVFLAAGLVVSVLAGTVERLASLRHGGGHQESSVSDPESVRALVRSRPLQMLVAVPVVGVLVIAGLIGGLFWASHYWSEPIGPGITTMTVQVERKGHTTTDVNAVTTVARYCTINTGIGVRFAGARSGPDQTVSLRVSPLLDADAQDRFIGCLEDAILEWHKLSVTQTALTPR